MRWSPQTATSAWPASRSTTGLRERRNIEISGSCAWARTGSALTSRNGRSGRRIRREPPRPVDNACDNGAVDEVLIVRSGLVPYEEARRLQKRIEEARQADWV